MFAPLPSCARPRGVPPGCDRGAVCFMTLPRKACFLRVASAEPWSSTVWQERRRRACRTAISKKIPARKDMRSDSPRRSQRDRKKKKQFPSERSQSSPRRASPKRTSPNRKVLHGAPVRLSPDARLPAKSKHALAVPGGASDLEAHEKRVQEYADEVHHSTKGHHRVYVRGRYDPKGKESKIQVLTSPRGALKDTKVPPGLVLTAKQAPPKGWIHAGSIEDIPTKEAARRLVQRLVHYDPRVEDLVNKRVQIVESPDDAKKWQLNLFAKPDKDFNERTELSNIDYRAVLAAMSARATPQKAFS